MREGEDHMRPVIGGPSGRGHENSGGPPWVQFACRV